MEVASLRFEDRLVRLFLGLAFSVIILRLEVVAEADDCCSAKSSIEVNFDAVRSYLASYKYWGRF